MHVYINLISNCMASVARCGSQNQGALKITVSSHRQKMHHLWLGPRSSHVAKTDKCVHVKFQHIHRARDPKSWHISQSIKTNLFTNLSYNTSPCPSKKKQLSKPQTSESDCAKPKNARSKPDRFWTWNLHEDFIVLKRPEFSPPSSRGWRDPGYRRFRSPECLEGFLGMCYVL